MLLDLIFTFYSYIIWTLNKLLPDWILNQQAVDAWQMMLGYIWQFDAILPIQDIMVVLTAIIGFEVSLLLVKLTFQIITIFRGGGSSS